MKGDWHYQGSNSDGVILERGQLRRSSHIVGRGGALVESIPFYRRVVGSNPALAAT